MKLTKNRHSGMAIAFVAAMLAIVVNSGDVLFDRIQPLIWILFGDAIVSMGTVEFDVNFGFTAPCPVYGQIIRSDTHGYNGTEISHDDLSKIDAFERSCNGLYVLEWLEEIKQLLATKIGDINPDQPRPQIPYKETSAGLTRLRRQVENYPPFDAINKTGCSLD